MLKMDILTFMYGIYRVALLSNSYLTTKCIIPENMKSIRQFGNVFFSKKKFGNV